MTVHDATTMEETLHANQHMSYVQNTELAEPNNYQPLSATALALVCLKLPRVVKYIHVESEERDSDSKSDE